MHFRYLTALQKNQKNKGDYTMFKCNTCGKEFKNFRNGGFIKNLKVTCSDCGGNKTFAINIGGHITHTTFDNALNFMNLVFKEA